MWSFRIFFRVLFPILSDLYVSHNDRLKEPRAKRADFLKILVLKDWLSFDKDDFCVVKTSPGNSRRVRIPIGRPGKIMFSQEISWEKLTPLWDSFNAPSKHRTCLLSCVTQSMLLVWLKLAKPLANCQISTRVSFPAYLLLIFLICSYYGMLRGANRERSERFFFHHGSKKLTAFR